MEMVLKAKYQDEVTKRTGMDKKEKKSQSQTLRGQDMTKN